MIRRAAAWLLCLSLALLCLLPAAAPAESGPRVIRVGWYETPFNHKDTLGHRTGYAYEYQRKIAAYTGWKYEYVEGSWAELLQMLEDGRIDLLSDVSFTEERTEYMYFSNLPMGSEMYYLFVTPDNREISADDYSTLNGKKVGITKSSVQLGFFLEWEQARGIETELVELTCSEEESMKMLTAGEIDAFVTLDTYGDPDVNVPLWKIGASDFYFAVSRTRPDLVPELDQAMNRIQDENKYYNEQLSIKYLRNSSANYYLSAEEQDWLAAHGPIRIGYQDNYLAFCASDPETGELTGALKDYLDFASGVLENADLSFVAVPYPTATAAMEALENGEIDCMFPSNLTDYDGEQAGVVMSPPMMSTEMDAVVREADRQDFLRKTQVRVAVNQGNPNYDMFLVDHFPNWTPVRYADTPACLDMIAAGNADCLIISNYRYNNISAQCKRLNLTTVYTGVDMDYCLAVKEGNTMLYSILAKVISVMPESVVNAALTYYAREDSRYDFSDFLEDHLSVVLGGISIVLLIIVLLLLYRLHAPKKPAKTSPQA